MITKEQIQWIVDGECSHETRALLLQELDAQPAGWRSLALALLEEQQWARELSIAPHQQGFGQKGILDGSFANAVNASAGVVRAQSIDSLSEPVHNGRQNLSRLPWFPVLAASLLLGLGIYGGSLLPNRFGNSTSVVDQQIAGSSNSTLSALSQPSYESDMKMLVSGPNKERSEIPVYDLNAADQELFLAKEKYEIAKINQRLRREGYELDVRPEFYTGKLNDGRNLIVPVKHVGVRPYGL